MEGIGSEKNITGVVVCCLCNVNRDPVWARLYGESWQLDGFLRFSMFARCWIPSNLDDATGWTSSPTNDGRTNGVSGIDASDVCRSEAHFQV